MPLLDEPVVRVDDTVESLWLRTDDVVASVAHVNIREPFLCTRGPLFFVARGQRCAFFLHTRRKPTVAFLWVAGSRTPTRYWLLSKTLLPFLLGCTRTTTLW